MGSVEISKNKTRISRYFSDLAKSLWQPLNIDVDLIFIKYKKYIYFYKYMHRTAQIFRTCSV